MVDRFHYLRQFAGEPVDSAAIDTLTTIVHRALFSDAPSVVGTAPVAATSRGPRRPPATASGPKRAAGTRARS